MTKTKTADGCKDAYHHGDLYNALIIAAAQVIEEHGISGFSLAKAARQAGVSAAAPYRHFRDKDDLLFAVAHLAFYALGQRCEQQAAPHPKDSSEHILALGEAYLTFMIEHKAFYELMWGDAEQRHWEDEMHASPCSYSFNLLLDAVTQWHKANNISSDTPTNIALRMWASTQGFATLSINQHLQRFDQHADPIKLFRASAKIMLAGLLQAD